MAVITGRAKEYLLAQCRSVEERRAFRAKYGAPSCDNCGADPKCNFRTIVVCRDWHAPEDTPND